MKDETKNKEMKCPFHHGASNPSYSTSALGTQNKDWWPNRLNLNILRHNSPKSNPYGAEFNYAKEFNSLNIEDLKKDLLNLMTNSQEWWPADFGHYGPFFIRMAWHSSGTYRITDGRSGARTGQLRFAPQNSWPDNGNLDKAVRLLWPIKKKYGKKISWADLIIYAGNIALESMGFETLGFAGGRVDSWESEEDVYWGKEKTWLGDERFVSERKLENPLAAIQMGLIYVNPQGPNSNPDPLASAQDIKETFSRMSMTLEETVALIAGGHSFGKTHGAAEAKWVGREPEASNIEDQGLGWKNTYGRGNAQDTISSGLEVTWSATPTQWSHQFFENLFKYDWELTKSPAGAHQWVAKNAQPIIPDPFDPNHKKLPTMLTTDLALKLDPEFAPIAKSFYENPQIFAKAFANAWFKLTHRHLGPKSVYLGKNFTKEEFLWEYALPKSTFPILNNLEVSNLKKIIAQSGLTIGELVSTAWASASTFRSSDLRGGANGGKIRFAPMKNWQVNQPERLNKIIEIYEKIQNQCLSQFNLKVSIADLIVLGGSVGIEKAALNAGKTLEVPFMPGRVDTIQEKVDPTSISYLEPIADGFRNYIKEKSVLSSTEELLIDKAQLLNLTIPELTVLIGGLRMLDINYNQTNYGVLTNTPLSLTNDFFVNLLSMETYWQPADKALEIFIGRNRQTNEISWYATRADLVFGSNSELRAVAEVYAYDDSKEKFYQDFVAAWVKIMNNDRFDLENNN